MTKRQTVLSGVSLYRTWRPKSFADLVGQDAVVRTLTSALGQQKLAHAYLFSGPRGSGKTSAAKILARCIDCVAGPTATPDNTCENCIAILEGRAFDVLEIDAASNRGIDEIRALRDAVKFPPSTMRQKVYIIDEAHMLTKEGANAFLKTLEEPPPHVVFILATTEPEKLPVTVLSRCQRYAFRRIAIPVMIERMREIAAAESIAIDDAALAAIAYRADGGLRDALTMLEQAAAFADGPIVPETIEMAFGASGRDYARTLVDACTRRDAAAVLATVDAATEAGTDVQVLIRTLIGEFRHLLVARVDPALLARDLAPEDARSATERAARISQAALVRALRLLAEAQTALRSSGNARLELEAALLRFVFAAEDPTLDALHARVSALEERRGEPLAARPAAGRAARPLEMQVECEPPRAAAPRHEPPPPAAPNGTASSAPLTVQKVRAAWQAVRHKAEAEKPPLSAPLSGATVDELHADDRLVVTAKNEPMAQILKAGCTTIERAIEEVLGRRLRLEFRVNAPAESRGRGSAPSPSATVQAQPQDDPEALFNYLNERIK